VRALSPPAKPRPAIERPGEVHLYLHGVTAEDVTAIIKCQNEQVNGTAAPQASQPAPAGGTLAHLPAVGALAALALAGWIATYAVYDVMSG
jgi:hypothetical protein